MTLPQTGAGPTVACPVCARAVPWVEASRWRPFCSERCRTIDLGDWAAERHKIPGATLDDQAAAQSAAAPDPGTPGSPRGPEEPSPTARRKRPASGA